MSRAGWDWVDPSGSSYAWRNVDPAFSTQRFQVTQTIPSHTAPLPVALLRSLPSAPWGATSLGIQWLGSDFQMSEG